MADPCFYCEDGERRKSLMIEICKLKMSTVYLFRDQKHKGRVILKCNRHVNEVFELTPEENQQYFAELSLVCKAIYNTFHPDKINYAIYGDLVQHLHIHIVPKYKDGLNWGGPFVDSPDLKVTLSEQEYQELITKIKEAIDALLA